MKTQIPIYRAKLKNNNEWIEGYYFQYDDAFGISPMIISSDSGIEESVDIETLAVHFPDMLDNQGVKIFASLSDSGAGGSIFKGLEYSYPEDSYVVIYHLGIPFACRIYKDGTAPKSRPFNMFSGCGWERVNVSSYPEFNIVGIYEGKLNAND